MEIYDLCWNVIRGESNDNKKRKNTNMIGTQVMQTRKEKGLTRSALIVKLKSHGIKMNWLSLFLLEKQKRRVIDIEFLALAKSLNVSMESLWGEDK